MAVGRKEKPLGEVLVYFSFTKRAVWGGYLFDPQRFSMFVDVLFDLFE